MKIGFDVDGVFANWNHSFMARIVAKSGRDLHPANYEPHTWHYPDALGYTREEVSAVWEDIKADPTFWLKLSPYWDAMTLLERVYAIAERHDVTFITSRPGVLVEEQTVCWLATHAGQFEWEPTVIVSGEKGRHAKALALDAYIDDRSENVVDVVTQSPATQTFLLDRPWNQDLDTSAICVKRVESVADMLDSLKLIDPARL